MKISSCGVLFMQYDNSLVQLQNSPSYQYKDADEIIKASRKRLSNNHAKICHCLDDVGLICAIEVYCATHIRLPCHMVFLLYSYKLILFSHFPVIGYENLYRNPSSTLYSR